MIGNGDTRKATTAQERIIANACHAIGNGDARKATAIIERIIANACYSVSVNGLGNYQICVRTGANSRDGTGDAIRVDAICQALQFFNRLDIGMGRIVLAGVYFNAFAFSSGRDGDYTIIPFMSKGRNNLLCYENRTAGRTMLALLLARCCTSGSNGRINYLGVTLCRNFVRRIGVAAMASMGGIALGGAGGSSYNRFVIVTVGRNRGDVCFVLTFGAVARLATLFRTSRSNVYCPLGAMVMSKGIDVSCLIVIANSTISPLATFFGASGCEGFCPYAPSVTLGRNLGYIQFVRTTRTVMRLATLFGAGRFHINDPIDGEIVSKLADSLLLAADLVIANRAIDHVIVVSINGTGGIYLVFYNGLLVGVTGSGNDFLLTADLVVANRTIDDAIVVSVYGAGSVYLVFYNGLLVGVTGSGNDFLLTADLVVTNRTIDDAIVASVYGTGGVHLVFHNGLFVGVTVCVDLSLLKMIASLAISLFGALLGAGSGFCDSPFTIRVAERLYVILCNQNLVTNRAVLAFGLALFGAGGRHGGVDGFGMTKSCDLVLHYQNLITNCAVLAFGFALLGTGGRNGGIDGFGMTKSCDLVLHYQNLIANRAVLAFGFALLGAGGRNGGINDLGVTFGARILFTGNNKRQTTQKQCQE